MLSRREQSVNDAVEMNSRHLRLSEPFCHYTHVTYERCLRHTYAIHTLVYYHAMVSRCSESLLITPMTLPPLRHELLKA